MKTIAETEQEIVDDFGLFDEWEEKYQYIIELGQKLGAYPEEFRTDDRKIKGCQSSVWLHSYEKDGLVYFEADSDSTFVKGEIALLINVLSGRKPEEIVQAELGFIDRIGFRQHVAQTRANGLSAMIKQMKVYALGFQIKLQNDAIPMKEAITITEPVKVIEKDSVTIPEVKGLRERIIDVLKSCFDPEIPVDIWELGLIYEINISDGNDVKIMMTLTSPACPVAETLPPDVEQKVRDIPDVSSAKVEITFEPPWEKEMMSDEAKLELGMW
jgi:cysteine desulfuration protein SufE